MKKVDWFVIKSFIGPLILTFFIVLIILNLQFLWMYIDELAGKGLNFKILIELLYHFSLTFVPTALPLAILLAALMTFGNLGEFSELTALKSSGIPLQRIMLSLVFLIGGLAVVSFFFANNVLPYSTAKARTLLYDIRRKKPDINIQAGTFYNGVPDFSIKVTKKDQLTGRMEKLIIYDHRDRRGNTSVILADSGYMKSTPDGTSLIMSLYNGYSFNEMEERNVAPPSKKFPSRKDYFKERTIVISLTGFDLERSSEGIFKSHASTLNISQLNYYIDSLNKNYNKRQLDQYREFNKSRLYAAENYLPKFDPADKKIHRSHSNECFDTKTKYDSLTLQDKKVALDKAIAVLKNGSSYLAKKNESIYYLIKSVKRYEVEWNKKFTFAVACLVFFFIGAPLGAIIRKGGLGTPSVISIFFFVIYYVISISGKKLVEENVIGTFEGMWASSYILFPIGIFLTYKATTDSVIMNIDTYLSFFRKIKDYLYKVGFNGNNKNTSRE